MSDYADKEIKNASVFDKRDLFFFLFLKKMFFRKVVYN